MIDAKTAFEYAQLLEEYVQAGNTIEQICACDKSKQVVRKLYHIMANPSMPITVEQIEASITSLVGQKEKLEEVKKEVEVEKEKLLMSAEGNSGAM